ncbi:MAG TPA: ASCH domain-containing protein [Bacillota bacterium]|nr:ASCH domain-containing protein [Bacillota bacterium]
MKKQPNEQPLPKKTCTIDRLVTIPKDVEKVINGEKTASRRNSRYADRGEVMILDDHRFVVDDIYTQKLGDMTEQDAQEEGYDSLDAYKQAILSIHPDMKWIPEMTVCVHKYSPLKNVN